MRLSRLTAVAVLGATLVTGCGGGGGGGGGDTPLAGTPGTKPGTPPVTPGGGWLSFTPASVALTVSQGNSAGFNIKATSTRTFDKPFNVAVIDTKGVITSDMNVNALSSLEYSVDMRTSSTLPVGTHTTNLEVRLCEDTPTVCSKPLPGSPWYVPLSVTVAAPTGATPPGSGTTQPGTPPGNGAAQPMTLSFAPATPDLLVYQGEPLSFTVEAQASGQPSPAIQLAVVDNAGIIAQGETMSAIGNDQYRVQLKTSSVLTPGQYNTSLEVRACYDDPRECRSPASGSPWRLPLQVTVKSGINLTPLAKLPDVAPWSTYAGNAAHTGFVPASFDPVNFNRRWNQPERGAMEVHAPAIDDGRVFVVSGSRFGNWELAASAEESGAVAWRVDMGSLHRVNPPAAAGGKVYVTSTGHADTFLWVFDGATGKQISKTPLNSQWESYLAPTVVGNMVYSNSGYYGGMVKFNATTNLVEWRNTSLPQVDGWTPAVDGVHAYTYLSGQLYAVDLASGNIAFTIANPGGQGYRAQALMLNGKQGIVADNGHLSSFDLEARTRTWETNGVISGQPVLARGVIYALAENGSVVEARAAATGMLQWKSAALPKSVTDGAYSRMVVTSNLVFASSGTMTVAVDIATRQQVWSYPLGGELAISDRGVLYIMARSGKLAAVNLR